MFTDSILRHDAVRRGAVALALVALASTPSAFAQSRPDTSSTPPKPDPRVGLHAGWMDAGQALWNMRLVSTSAPPSQFTPENPGDFDYLNSDLAFDGRYVIQGNFQGFQVWDMAQPSHPTPVVTVVCPGSQNDVSVYHNLLFLSVESTAGRIDCGTQGVQDTVSADRMRGIRIWDITDIAHPKPIVNVQTCRGSHTHTLVTAPADTANVYIYVSGSAPVRSPTELAGCSALRPDEDPNSELFRIEVIQVPLAHPEQAHVVSKPAILAGLAHTEGHGEAPEDIAAAKRAADSARATGAYVVTVFGNAQIVPPGFVRGMLDSLVRARNGTGAPTAADSALLRDSIQAIVDRLVAPRPWPGGVRPGPVQCHDITVYPALGLAGGACGGYGVLLDIRDPANPRRLAAVADSNFAFWHSATFNNDGTAILFTDEWGGGLGPKCRPTDDPKWGADALFSLKDNTLTFRSYYKVPAPQTARENCVAHNGSLIPVPGRDIMVQGWYQGGVSVFDWTDPAHPREIAFFDRGPMDSLHLQTAGSWSAYWYNGHIVSSEIGRGLDILELLPNGLLTQNEIEAAKLVRVDRLNVQDQQKLEWPASFVVVRAYLDQLARGNGLAPARVTTVRSALVRAERAAGQQRRALLTQLAGQLDRDATGAADQAKVRALATAVRNLSGARP
ncbi:MAG TPA: hypothetical protein VLB49_00665 [Gemmatimonadales bacterium]|nr:hypothetical protein [Gemmatimonadales bacterium]